MKGDKTKPATDAEVTTVDPESGYEGERRGTSTALHLVISFGTQGGMLMRNASLTLSPFPAPGKNERGQARPRGHGEGSGRGRATRTRGRGQAPGAGYQGGERRNDGRRSAHALPDTEKRVASGWGAEDGAAELTGKSTIPQGALSLCNGTDVDGDVFADDVAEVEGATDATKEAAEPQTPAGVSDHDRLLENRL